MPLDGGEILFGVRVLKKFHLFRGKLTLLCQAPLVTLLHKKLYIYITETVQNAERSVSISFI